MRINKFCAVWQGFKTGVQLVLGGGMTFLWGFYVLMYLAGFEATQEDDPQTFRLAVVFCALFAVMLWRGCVNLALLLKLQRYNKAVEILSPENGEELAKGVLEAPAKVEKALARMIRLRLIPTVPYRQRADFTVHDSPASPQAEQTPEEAPKAEAREEEQEIDPDFSQSHEEKITVTCPYCRGVSIITKGTQAPCDYCKKILGG